MTYVDPDSERFAAFRALEHKGPVQMLNLIRYRQRAAYEDGREATGREAYAAYSRASLPVFKRVGGRQVWIAFPELLLIGPANERWDIAFVAEYPSGTAFVEMVRDPEYREAVKHRTAAVENSRLLRMSPTSSGSGFGATSTGAL